MNRASWSPEEIAEYEAMLQKVVEDADGTRSRVDLMESLVGDAVQAHRYWARDCEREARRVGFAAQIKSYLKRNRVLFINRDAAVSKPRVVGLKRSTAEGEVYDVQALIEAATFDELRDKRIQAIKQIKSYSDTVALLDRVLALKDMYPHTQFVVDALHEHGMSLDEYLATPERAA